MKIEKIKEEKKNKKLSFLLKGSNEVFANTIRRMIIEEVPTLAVEDIEIKDNNSALFDEMLGLRLGLLPISTDLKSYNLKENCPCQGAGCAQWELKLTLKAAKKGYVYDGDANSTDPKCTFVNKKTPIVKLLAKQKVDLTMTAILGKGKDHAKWSPGIAFYQKEPIVKIGKVSDPPKIVENCPDGVFTIKSNKLTVAPDKVYTSQLLSYYSELDQGITVEQSENIIFTVESWGQLSCKEMLLKSADLIIEKAEILEKEI